MKIYTRQGDKGHTSLFGGERVQKNCPRAAAYGSIDELNALLAMAKNLCRSEEIKGILLALQNELFKIGTDLATKLSARSRVSRIKMEDWQKLESEIDRLDKNLPPLRDFILPGGLSGAACIHLARSVCRRAERRIVTLMQAEDDINPELLRYVNRLSDLLFVMARYENITEGGEELKWQK